MWKVLGAILVLTTVAVGLTFYKGISQKNSTPTPPKSTTQSETVEVIAKNLEVPWALAFLPASPAGGPNGDILVTERKGSVKLINKNREVTEVGKVNVKQQGESGLHGIAIHPKYPEKPFVYLYYTYSSANDNSLNRVSRFSFADNQLKDEQIIVSEIPGAVFHDGGRIKFGPDGYLYITTGDAQNPSLSQDKNSLAGKILRVTDDEKMRVFSYGHRNPQGITWDDKGNLWETEHGQSAQDEINLIQQGQNYGWPVIRGNEKREGMVSPLLQSESATWAPAGTAFLNGSIYFGGLRGQALFEVKLDTLELKEHFKGQFGRIREVVLGPDNRLYITTSNRDGRGSPSPDDDKILVAWATCTIFGVCVARRTKEWS